MSKTLIRFVYDPNTFELHQTIIPSVDDTELLVHGPMIPGDVYTDVPISYYMAMSSNGLPIPDLIQQFLASQ